MRRDALIISILFAVVLICCSCSTSKSSSSDKVGNAPVANFTGSPLSGDPSLQVTFTNTSTGTIDTCSWDFGDGGVSSAASPVHTYDTDGVYTVSLTVVGPGGSDTETKVAYITCGNPPGPTVDFEGTPLSGTEPLPVTFTDLSTGNNVHAWSWSFGDGGTSTQQHPQHTYNTAGTFDVTLTATDDDGTKSLTKTTYVDVSSGATVDPPLGGSSSGSGGSYPGWGQVDANSISCYIIVPNSYDPAIPNAYLIVYSGTEGDLQMTQNILSLMGVIGLSDFIITVLDGMTYYNNPDAGATVLDWTRANYNIDNDKTCLLGESAGTGAALLLGFNVRQSYFAAYWANDVNTQYSPQQTAAELGFAPWGNAGPGGLWDFANYIVDGMRDAGYRLPPNAPYNGTGCDEHGSIDQLIAAMQFFPGKSRQ